MPRKKTLTREEIIAAGQDLHRRMKYYSEHPEELQKKEEEQARAEDRKIAKRMKKHQPQVTDIEKNGDYVSVYFIRNNGEPVIGWYKRMGWDGMEPQKRATAAWKRRLDYWNPESKDAAAPPPPPEPGEAPRS